MAYPRHVVAGPKSQALFRINEDGVNLAIWERTLPAHVQSYLASARVFSSRYTTIDVREVREAVLDRYPDFWHSPAGLWLAHDIERLAHVLTAIRNSPKVRIDVRCGRWSTAGWHNDYTHARVLVTYRGEGTQWVANRHVIRKPGSGGKLYVAQSGSVPEEAPVHTIGAGHVAVITGAHWKNGTVPPIAHRPPPDVTPDRVLVVIDPDPE